ncbi:MAG: hypothetical protein ACREM8_08820, partial [Vulcanimicrobiaceae bacterium]
LLTSFYYVAPSGTALGTSLTFKILAVDWTGNASAYSAASSATTTDGIIAADVGFTVGGGNLVSNSSFEDVTDFQATSPYSKQDITWSYDTASAPLFGTYAFKVQHRVSGDSFFFMSLPGITGASFNGKKLTLSYYAKADSGSTTFGNAPALQDYSGHYIAPDGSPVISITTAWVRYTMLFTLGGAAFAAGDTVQLVLRPLTDVGSNNIYYDGVQLELGDVATAYHPKTNELLTAVIGTAQIQTLAVTDAQIANMVVDKLLAGSLQVFGILTTGGLRTATTGARIVLDGTSLRVYDSTATNYGAPSGAGVTAELGHDGSAFFQGTVSASKVYASTIATSAGIAGGITGSGAGYRLGAPGAIPYLDFFTVGSIVGGERYYYAPDNNTAYALAGVMAAGTMTFAKGGADADSESITTTGTPIIASALAIASFKPNTTIALRSLGAFTSTVGGSITPPFGASTASGSLLIAWVACNAASPPSITTASSGWVKAVAANATNAEADIWYKLNSGSGESAPVFTATLVSPSSADSNADTITTAGTVAANAANAVLASFAPASTSTPIALVSAGAFATGSANSVSPAFGQPTAGGNLLVAFVSGQIGTSGGGTANLGNTGAATYSFDFSGVNSDNVIFMGPYSMPQHGTITQISIYMGGYGGSVTGCRDG